ncbi:MAG: SNF2-related protein, partial [Candidatus Bipolaricaulota bacterium]|nr:SNF2-related protein [Candidatus Bipolaricaulota bacterium]
MAIMGIRDVLRLLRGESPPRLPLVFKADRDEEDHYTVGIYYRRNGSLRKIPDVERLMQDPKMLRVGGRHYTITPKDQEILLCLRSLNPRITEANRLVCELLPDQLGYLRESLQFEETDSLKEIELCDAPLLPRVEIDYDPQEGVRVEPSFDRPDAPAAGSLSHGQVNRSPDGRYARVGNSFYRYPRLDETAEGYLEDEQTTISPAGVPEFFTRDLALLKNGLEAVVLSPAAKDVRIIDQKFSPIINVRSDEKGWLDFDLSYDAGGYRLPHRSVKRADSDYVRKDDTAYVKVDKAVVKRAEQGLEKLGAVKADDGYRVPVWRFASLEDFIGGIGGERVIAREYQEFLNALQGFTADEGYQLPEAFEGHLAWRKIELRPYQRAGIHWLNWLRENQLHGILADDMGLGKTLQTIAMLWLGYQKQDFVAPSLIVSPKSVLPHWARQLQYYFPDVQIYRYVGPRRRADEIKPKGPTFVLTTYDTLARDADVLQHIPFLFLVLDEATYIKNPSAERTKGVKAINAVHRLCLSGTPIENRPAELWSLFDFLMRGHLGRASTFIKSFENPILQGDVEASNRLAARIEPFLLRREKQDVAQDLPEKIEMDEWCSLTEEQRLLYKQIQDKYKEVVSGLSTGENVEYTSIFTVIQRLREVCDHPALITGKREPVLGRSEKFDLAVEKI